jgi:hypothetical protein
MSFEEFKQKPWRTSHDAYKNSAFAMSPAPEYASSEVLLASLCRAIGLDGVNEGRVPVIGRGLERAIQSGKKPEGALLSPDAWNKVVHWVLESPKLPKQSSKRFLQMSPVVPEVARYSGSARLAGNPWRPGQLVQWMVWLGSEDAASAWALWGRLFTALEVGEDDDVWARWLEQEFRTWSPKDATPFAIRSEEQSAVAAFPQEERARLRYPARQFVKDLDAVILAKPSMTRRQWTSMLESIIRLAATSHVMWTCELHDALWRLVYGVLVDNLPAPSEDEVRKHVFPGEVEYFAYGQAALRSVRSRAESYLQSRLGLNLVLWSLKEAGVEEVDPLSSSAAFANFCRAVSAKRSEVLRNGFATAWEELQDREASTLACTKGIGSNIHEFARHALGQRQTLNNVLKGYDQGYVLRKKGDYNGAPWVVSLGPVLVIALVHCCLHESGGPRSVHRLCQHLAEYGIAVNKRDIGSSELGASLRMLGLVLDSPDAESGMLLLPPFSRVGQRSEMR